MSPSLPPNVHVSHHPCLRAKLSQLRSRTAGPRETSALVHEIALIVACEAFSQSLTAVEGEEDQTPIGFRYDTLSITPSSLCIVPILRSGLAMVQAVQTMLPALVPVHHLGMYREPSTLDPVEYYNNLPNHTSSTNRAADLAVLVDPVIATGGTCAAAVQTLREWGARRVLVLSVMGARDGVARAAAEWADGTDIFIAAVDDELTPGGMVKPGLGDVGDRLFLTIGK